MHPSETKTQQGKLWPDTGREKGSSRGLERGPAAFLTRHSTVQAIPASWVATTVLAPLRATRSALSGHCLAPGFLPGPRTLVLPACRSGTIWIQSRENSKPGPQPVTVVAQVPGLPSSVKAGQGPSFPEGPLQVETLGTLRRRKTDSGTPEPAVGRVCLTSEVPSKHLSSRHCIQSLVSSDWH